jgi:hypothetical protein
MKLLFAFFVGSMSTAKPAVFFEFKLARGVFLIFGRSVITMLTFRTGECDYVSHC